MKYDAIYLSPHLDDVALSCGGQIFMQTAVGQRVLIVTIMAGEPPAQPISPFAATLHARWELAAQVVAQRRAEDVAACAILGAEYAHWQFPDCIYRQHPESGDYLYTSEEALFAQVHEGDTAVLPLLTAQLRTLPPCERLFCPMGVGNHVDHQLVRTAAEACFAATTLLYYEDYPYTRDPAALDRVLSQGGWQAEVVPLLPAAVAARVAAIAAYASQVGSFFNGRADLEAQLSHYISQVGGERIWRRIQTA